MTGKTKEKRAKDRAWKKLVKESQKNYWRGVIERTQKELDEYGLGGYASTRKRIDITLCLWQWSAFFDQETVEKRTARIH